KQPAAGGICFPGAEADIHPAEYGAYRAGGSGAQAGTGRNCRFQQQEEEILQKEAHIQETLAAIREAERILREDEEQASQSQKEKEELNRRHKSFFARRDELSQQVNLMDKECFRLTIQREKLEECQDALTDYLWEA